MELFVAGCSTSWSSRSTSCYMLDGHILFDCGEGSSKSIVKKYGEQKLRDIDWIFITHLHTDHIFSINQYISQKTIFAFDPNHKLTVVGVKGLKNALNILFTFVTCKDMKLEDYINIIEIEDYSISFKVDNYTIYPFKLVHGDFENCGFAISDGQFTLGYTGDTIFDDNLLKMVDKCDTLLCDVSGEVNKANHMGVDGYHELVEKYPNKQFFAVHCNEYVYQNARKLKLNLIRESTLYNYNKGIFKKV